MFKERERVVEGRIEKEGRRRDGYVNGLGKRREGWGKGREGEKLKEERKDERKESFVSGREERGKMNRLIL